MQPFNRRKEGDRACRIDNKMGVLFLDHVQGSIHAGEDFKVFKLGGAALQVCREVRKSFLGRNLGYFYRKASYGILFSSSVTLHPTSAAVQAASSPAVPAPTTTTWHGFLTAVFL